MVALTHDASFARHKADLKEQIDLRDFYQSVNGSGKRSGRALVDRVPWREDHKPSLNVYTDGWIDRATGDSGDIFALAGKLYNCDFARAFQHVKEWYGSSTPVRHPKTALKNHKNSTASEPPDARAQHDARQTIDAGVAALWSTEGAAILDYLRTHHGLTDDTIRNAQLGYASAATMQRLFPKFSRSDAVIIPWIIASDVWAVKFRRLTPHDDEPKYIQLSKLNQAGALYGADFLRAKLPVIFVEGEFKALLGQQEASDLVNFVSAGSATGRLPERFETVITTALRIILCRDNDDTGQANADKNMLGLPNNRTVVTVPQDRGDAKALDDYHLLGGDVRAWITELLSSAPRVTAPLPFKVERTLNCYDSKHAPALSTLLRAILEYVGIDQPFTKKDLAKRSGVSELLIHRAMNYGGKKICQESVPPDVSIKCAVSPAPQGMRESNTIQSSSDTKAVSGGKRATYWRLPADWPERLLMEVLMPGIIEKIAKAQLSPKFERASLERYQSIWAKDGERPDLQAVEEVNARLCGEIPEALRAAIDDEIAQVRRELSDSRGAALPDLWKTDYRAALLERDIRPRLGVQSPRYKTEAVTGLSSASQRSAEQRIFIFREPVLVEGPVIEKVADLPEPVRSAEYHGTPAWAVFDDGMRLNYRSRKVRTNIRLRVSRGERCRIDYQQASIPREVPPEERAAKPPKTPARPQTDDQKFARKKQAAENVYRRAVETVKWQLRYLGYCSANGATYDRYGELVAEKPMSELRGSDLIRLARGLPVAEVCQQLDILAQYYIPRGEPVKVDSLYHAIIRHTQDGLAILAALPAQVKEYVALYAQDEEVPEMVVIEAMA